MSRGAVRAWAVVACVAAAVLVGGPVGAQTPPAGEAVAEAPVTLSAELRTLGGQAPITEARLGDRLELVLTVEAPRGAQVFVPDKPALERFQTLGERPPTTRADVGDRVRETYRIPLSPVRVGPTRLAAVEVPYRLPDGASGVVHTPKLRVHVRGHLSNEQDPKLGAAPPPVPVITTNWLLVWGLSLVGAAAAAALLTLVALRVLRSRLAAAVPPPPPRPANEVALDKLAALEAAELTPEARYAATADILREYLGGRYGFDGLEMTTGELRRALVGADLKDVTPTQIEVALGEADLVKFARLSPSDAEARGLAPEVRRIVEATWEAPKEEPTPEQAAAPRFEPAEVRERVRAGLIDVGFAAAVALSALGGLWATGRLAEWGWAAGAAFAVVLAVRDVLGPVSVGKALVGLHVVSADERQALPGWRARLTRNALLLVPPVGLVVEGLVLLHHPLRRRLGDGWARTEVVRGASRPAPRGGRR